MNVDDRLGGCGIRTGFCVHARREEQRAKSSQELAARQS
jgi:hypothetical protein